MKEEVVRQYGVIFDDDSGKWVRTDEGVGN